MRTLNKVRERWNQAQELCAAKRRADHYLATRAANGPLFRIDCEPLYQLLLGQFKSRLFNIPRWFQRSEFARSAEYNRWVRSKLQKDETGMRFVGEGFSLSLPQHGAEDSTETFVSDLREILLENHYSCRFPQGQMITDGGVVLDCGANIGTFAVWVGSMFPNARILAFEPEPMCFRALADNVARNDLSSRVQCLENGVSDCSGQFELLCNDRAVTQHKLVKTYNAFMQHEQRRRAARAVQVKCITIDQVVDEQQLDRCNLIKMDIEGAEPEALRGATKTIQRFRPRLALAAYHRLSDPYVLPLIVKEICPDYNVVVSDGHLFAFV